jgi:hypothetical protein
MRFLASRGLELRPSTKHENCDLDIDGWTQHGTPVSIKCQHTALRTGNIAFEFEVTGRDGNTYPGWFESGEAKLYLIIVGNQLYQARKAKLKAHIADCGWKRVASLSADTRASQQAIGHFHVDARVGLLPLSELIKHQVLKFVCEVPDYVSYPPR